MLRKRFLRDLVELECDLKNALASLCCGSHRYMRVVFTIQHWPTFQKQQQFPNWHQKVQVILFEIDCAVFYPNLRWTNCVNSGKLMDNCWIPCQVMAYMKKVYDDLIMINLYYEKKVNLLSCKYKCLYSTPTVSSYWKKWRQCLAANAVSLQNPDIDSLNVFSSYNLFLENT